MERKWILEPKDLAFCPWILGYTVEADSSSLIIVLHADA